MSVLRVRLVVLSCIIQEAGAVIGLLPEKLRGGMLPEFSPAAPTLSHPGILKVTR